MFQKRLLIIIIIYSYCSFNKYLFLIESSGRYYVGLWAVNCSCKDDPPDKICDCVSCKFDDDNATFKSKHIFESLMWKPNCSKILLSVNTIYINICLYWYYSN